jgi:lipoate-protein ligase A
MHEASYKVPGGKLVKAKVRVEAGRIAEIVILGDFFLHPEETLQKIEDALRGTLAEEASIERVISKVLTESDAIIIGATAQDMAKTIMLAFASSS